MEHFRLRKYRGPDVWGKVREAYVAGEPGPQVARRFDVGLANLRKKAAREGWTRTAAARASDPLILATQTDVLGVAHDPVRPPPPAHPAEARDAAIGRAAALLAEGRAAEATALLRAAETLGRLAAEAVPPPETEPTPEAARRDEWEARRAGEEQARAVFDEVRAHFRDVALTLAGHMLAERPNVIGGHEWCLAAWHWRARVLGPEIALSDFAAGVNGGWADRYWDAVGTLHPLTRDIPEPDPFMVRQHLRDSAGADMREWPWNEWDGDEEVQIALGESKLPRARVG